jgi:hypothetical protein
LDLSDIEEFWIKNYLIYYNIFVEILFDTTLNFIRLLKSLVFFHHLPLMSTVITFKSLITFHVIGVVSLHLMA